MLSLFIIAAEEEKKSMRKKSISLVMEKKRENLMKIYCVSRGAFHHNEKLICSVHNLNSIDVENFFFFESSFILFLLYIYIKRPAGNQALKTYESFFSKGRFVDNGTMLKRLCKV